MALDKKRKLSQRSCVLYGLICVFLITGIAVSIFFRAKRGQTEDPAVVQEIYDKGQVAKEYVKTLAQKDCGIRDEDMATLEICYFTDNADSYLVGISYLEANTARKKVYGYRVKVDDHNNCSVLEKGEALGKQMITVNSAPEWAGEEKMSLEKVQELAEKGDAITWKDFAGYDCYKLEEEAGIVQFDVEEDYILQISGSEKEEKPDHIRLIKMDEPGGSIDIRSENVEEFIAS